MIMKSSRSKHKIQTNKTKNKTLSKLSIEGNLFNMVKVLTKPKQNKNTFSKQTWEWNVKSFLWNKGQDRENSSGMMSVLYFFSLF